MFFKVVVVTSDIHSEGDQSACEMPLEYSAADAWPSCKHSADPKSAGSKVQALRVFCVQHNVKYACSEEVPEPVDLQGAYIIPAHTLIF